MTTSHPTDTLKHRAGEGLAIGRSLLNPIDNPIINPFESDIITLRIDNEWMVIIGTVLTVYLDEDLSTAYLNAISSHFNKTQNV